MADILPSSLSPQSNDGAADDSLDASARKSSKRQSGNQGSQASVQSGPPYICPTCQTNYSRLEYLRRHERRHADIRPFVCDCGKGFSRSDVLSRHKRQCAVHLNGGAEEGNVEGASSLKAATTGRKASVTRNKKQKTGRKSQSDDLTDVAAAVAEEARANEFAQSPSQSGSFPFQQPSLPSAPPPLLPPAPYANDINNEFARVNQLNANSFGAISHHLSALNNFTGQQQNYPSSPESNGTISQHSSPRFASRDMSRHGSNGSRLSMRKSGAGGGGALDHINARNAANVATNPINHYPPEFWEALDPAAKQVNDYVSAAPTTHPTLSLSAEATAVAALTNPTASGNTAAGVTSVPGGGVNTPRGEPHRFSVPSGPLSPFSSIALGSSMSPYLSAFSNARDTPFVASPSRGGVPGTPGSNLNIFDWTMRPPSKPASSSNKRDSASMQNSNSNSGTANKRVKEEDEDALANANADERSAAALLDSLRNAGRPQQITSTSSSTQADTTTSGSTPATSISDTQTTTIPTSSTAPTAPNVTSAINGGDTESFFEYGNVTAGPEAFLLRLQGGVQEERLGTAGPNTTLPMVTLPDMYDSGDLYLSQMGNYSIPHASWDNIYLGTTPQGNAPALSSSSMGWLLSPGVQQIINSYAGSASLPGENGNYFSGDTNTLKVPKVEDTSMQINAQALEKALTEVKNPFHIPPHMLRAAYAVDHWALPSLSRLSVLALHAQQNLLKHFPILHEPTFRIDTTPGCLAFTMAMLGCYRHGRMWWTGEEAVPRKGQSRESNGHLTQETSDNKADLTAPRYDEEDGEELVRPIVMNDKNDMLMRSFASRAKTEKDKASVVQALTLFQGNNFLSSDASTRSVAAINHTSLVTLAKKAGLFDSTAEHSKRKVTYTGDEVMRTAIFESTDLCFSYSYLPAYLPSCSNDEKIWRRWVELAGRRRTAHLLFIMDMVASLDEGINTQVTIADISHLPLPSPDTIWRAPTVEQWKQALEEYSGPTLNDALTELLQGQRSSKVSIFGRHGPFARLVMMIGLLHGIVHLLDDRRRKVSTPSPLAQWLPDHKEGQAQDDAEIYKVALTRWREAWDADNLCLTASVAAIGSEKAAARLRADADMSWLGNHFLFASRTASGATPLSDDALPIYWFAVILVGQAITTTTARGEQNTRLNNDVPLYLSQLAESLEPSFKDEEKIWVTDRKEDGQDQNERAAPDYKAMLRFAKSFVSNGEQMKQ